ncbi:MAG: MarR family transcriptional regulator [Thermoplasmata archaeon]
MDPVEEMILVHIYRFGADSPKYMAFRLLGSSGYVASYDRETLKKVCKDLETKGMLEVYRGNLKRSPTSSIKPWIKIKAREMNHQPAGIYYCLTKNGKRIAHEIYQKKFRKDGVKKE